MRIAAAARVRVRKGFRSAKYWRGLRHFRKSSIDRYGYRRRRGHFINAIRPIDLRLIDDLVDFVRGPGSPISLFHRRRQQLILAPDGRAIGLLLYPLNSNRRGLEAPHPGHLGKKLVCCHTGISPDIVISCQLLVSVSSCCNVLRASLACRCFSAAACPLAIRSA